MMYQLLLLLSITIKHASSLIKSYKLLKSEEIYNALHSLSKTYPSLTKLKTAQEMYNLPTVGKDEDCPYDTHYNSKLTYSDSMNMTHYIYKNDRTSSGSSTPGCNIWVLTIEDKIAHPVGSESHNALPEVFISGAMHGRERVGPTVVIETASLLLEAAHCESLPMSINQPTQEDTREKWKLWQNQINESRRCRTSLKRKGIYDNHRKWLARLVTTRRIVMVPTVNSIGFFRNSDRESEMSIKSDFPFDLDMSDSTNNENENCMKTIGARAINELYRTHIFQISISFHSGKVFAGYPYGSLSNLHKVPPDTICMEDISEAISVYGSAFKWSEFDRYPTGQINDLIGPSTGRFEDWSYAASWHKNSNMVCTPKTYGGYNPSKTTYDSSMLRSISFLIETSLNDRPPKNHLGKSKKLLCPNYKGSGNGHIPRNFRAIVMALDIVQPYVSIQSVNHLELMDDVVPLTTRVDRDCIKSKIVHVPEGTDRVDVYYEVGGVINIDDTSIWYGQWDDLPPGFNGNTQPTSNDIAKFYSLKNQDRAQISPGNVITDKKYDKYKTHQWYHREEKNKKNNDGPIFKASINLSNFKENDLIAIFGMVEADESWVKKSYSDKGEELLPQSHLVNARTNPNWYHVNPYTNKYVQGRRKFFSIPLTIKISNKSSTIQDQSLRAKYYKGHTKEVIQEIERDSIDVFVIVSIICFIGHGCYIVKRFYLKKKIVEDEFHVEYPMNAVDDIKDKWVFFE